MTAPTADDPGLARHVVSIPTSPHEVLAMIRAVRWTAVVVPFLFGTSATPAAGADPARKPNVIVFLVDDMGWTDCGVQGSTYYETPNIDRFAARAMRFTSAYAQPLCPPTRAS